LILPASLFFININMKLLIYLPFPKDSANNLGNKFKI
jgi:hypothetical protein